MTDENQGPVATDSGGGYSSITVDGFEVEASGTTPDEMTERHKPVEKTEPPESDSDDEPIGDEKPDEKPDPAAPKKRSARARMLEATRQNAETKRTLAERERELEEARRERDEWRQKLEQLHRPPQQQQKKSDDLKPEDFDTYEAYQRAMFERVADQRFEQRMRQQTIEAAAHAEAREIVQSVEVFSEHATGLLDPETGDGSPEVETILSMTPTRLLLSNQAPNSSTDLAQLILDSGDMAPTIIRHLAEHMDDLRGLIDSRNNAELTRKFGRIEERLSGGSAQPQKPVERPRPVPARVSQAPAPIKPVRSSRSTPEPDMESMDPDDYFEYRARQDRAG